MDRGDILSQANEITHGDRDKNYGSPLINHQRIAAIWSVILEKDVRPDQVALCMAGVKLARLVETPNHADSFVDGAAYFAIAGEIAGEIITDHETDWKAIAKAHKEWQESGNAKIQGWWSI